MIKSFICWIDCEGKMSSIDVVGTDLDSVRVSSQSVWDLQSSNGFKMVTLRPE